jgi:hypothetical protein
MGRNEAAARFFRDGLYIGHVAARRRCEWVLNIFELEVNMIPDELVNAQQRETDSGSDVSACPVPSHLEPGAG